MRAGSPSALNTFAFASVSASESVASPSGRQQSMTSSVVISMIIVTIFFDLSRTRRLASVDLRERFGELGHSRPGRDWIARLPRLVEECAEQWALEVGDPFPGGAASLALPAALPDGG